MCYVIFIGMNLQENIDRVREMMGINYAAIKILIPMNYLSEKYRYQVVPYHMTQNDNRIYVRVNGGGGRSISTKSIEILGIGSETEMKDLISKIKSEKDERERVETEKLKDYIKVLDFFRKNR